MATRIVTVFSSLKGTLHKDETTKATYCVYNSDVATGYGVGAFLFLLSSESLLMGVTKCMCFGRPLAPGRNRAWTIIYFVSSWMTFMVAEAYLVAGARQKGVFIAGAVFVVVLMILNVYFDMYFTKANYSAAISQNKSC